MNILVIRIFFHIYVLVTYVLHVWFYLILAKQSGDIEQNPGPKSNFPKVFPFVTGILSSLHLDSNILNDDDNLEIPGYDLVRADHPSNTKR